MYVSIRGPKPNAADGPRLAVPKYKGWGVLQNLKAGFRKRLEAQRGRIQRMSGRKGAIVAPFVAFPSRADVEDGSALWARLQLRRGFS